MEQLDNLIYYMIYDDLKYSLIPSKLESLSKDQLEKRLNCLVNANEHNGKTFTT